MKMPFRDLFQTERSRWAVGTFIAVCALILGALQFNWHRELASFKIYEGPFLKSDEPIFIIASNSAAQVRQSIDIEFDGLIFNKSGTLVPNDSMFYGSYIWVFNLKNYTSDKSMLKDGKHKIRIRFQGGKFIDLGHIVFASSPLITRVYSSKTDPKNNNRLIQGIAATPSQLIENEISVDIIYYHSSPMKAIPIETKTNLDDKSGIIYFTFETTVDGTIQFLPSDPEYKEAYFALSIKDMAGNDFFIEQTYEQFIALGTTKFGASDIANIQINNEINRDVSESLIRNIFTLTPLGQKTNTLHTNDHPNIKLRVTRISQNSRMLSWESNVEQSVPLSHIYKNGKKITSTEKNSYLDNENEANEDISYRITQEGKNGATYSSNTYHFENKKNQADKGGISNTFKIGNDNNLNSNRYTVQLAAFRSLKDTVVYMSKIERKGFEAYRMEKTFNDNTWYRIRSGKFATFDDAQKYLKTLENEGVNGIIIRRESQ